MSFTLRKEHFDRIKQICSEAGRKKLEELGLDPESTFSVNAKNGAFAIDINSQVVAKSYRLPLSDPKRVRDIADWEELLNRSKDKTSLSIENDTAKLAEEHFETYLAPQAPRKYKTKEAENAWKDDPRSKGLEYSQVEEAVTQLCEQAAASAVLKYLDTLPGWNKGPEAGSPSPS